MFQDLNDFIGFGEIIVAVIVAFVYVRSRIPKQTIEQQTQLIAALEGRIKAMEDESKEQLKKHIENEKAIADLQGQIKVYKEIPLQDIAKSLKVVENLPKEFERISRNNSNELLKAIRDRNIDQPVVV